MAIVFHLRHIQQPFSPAVCSLVPLQGSVGQFVPSQQRQLWEQHPELGSQSSGKRGWLGGQHHAASSQHLAAWSRPGAMENLCKLSAELGM